MQNNFLSKKSLFLGLCTFFLFVTVNAQTYTEDTTVTKRFDIVEQNTASQNTAEQPPATQTVSKSRPTVALVLGGGGARGFAHLPILEMIDELGIPVDMVLGTSIGAIVGGLYSSGYSAKEITDLFMTTKWSGIFQDESVTSFERLLGSHSTYSSPFSVKFGTDLSLNMGAGLLTGQNAYSKLKEMTAKIPSYTNFDDLPIPFRATAVNLITGELVFYDSGDLAEVIRASMSIPAVFEPFEIDNKLYVDGGAREQVPIIAAKEMGYDIVIAVDISPRLEESADVFEGVPFLSLWQMINMPQAAQTEEASAYADIVITPKIDQYTILDFDKGEEIYEQGQRDVEKVREQLIEIKNRIFPDGENAQIKTSSKEKYDDMNWLVCTDLKIKGAVNNDEKDIYEIFEKDLKDKELTEKQINEIIKDVYATGNYKRVLTRTIKDGGNCTLELLLDAKDAENGLLLLGGNYAGTLSTDTSSSIILENSIQFRGLTGPGSAFSIKASMLNKFSAELVYLQPISSIAYFQVSADYSVDMITTTNGIDAWEPVVYRTPSTSASFLLGAAFNRSNTLLFGGGIHSIYMSNKDLKAVAGLAEAQYTFNNLNAQVLPDKGVYFSLTEKGLFPIEPVYETKGISLTDVDITFAIPVTSKFSIIGNVFVGTNVFETYNDIPQYLPIASYSVYDRRFFPHVSGSYLTGVHKGACSLSLQIKPVESLTLLGGQLALSVTGALGNVWNYYSDVSTKNLLWRGSLDLGIQIKSAFCLVGRVGVGSSRGKVCPFISFDIGNIRY